MTEDVTGATRRLRSLHEIMFCLDLGFSIALAATLLLLGRRIGLVHGRPEVRDPFLETLIRINTFFHLHPLDPLGVDVVLTAFTLAFFVLLLVLVRLIARTGAIDITLNFVAAAAALTAVPISWFPYHPIAGGYSMNTPMWLVLALEFAVVGGALLWTRRRPIPAWFIVLILHYGIWLWFLWHGPWNPFFLPASLVPMASQWPILLSIVSPCSGFVWAVYRIHMRRDGGWPGRQMRG